MKLYNDYNSYLREKYGCKVYRIGLDAGFSCPNRDGTKGTLGCLYCNEDGSRASYADPQLSVKDQLSKRIEYLKKNKGASKFIAYFQAFTNTHSPVEKLKSVYDGICGFNDIVGLSIGTRPDSVDSKKIDLISSYKEKYETWIEYGLQSSHDRTLKLLDRGHTFKDFTDAVGITRSGGIKVSCHVILGLPGETKSDMLETARKLSQLNIDGIKIHLLHVLKGSRLEELYLSGKVTTLKHDEYAGLVCDFLENLSAKILIQRLTGEGPKEKHVAPSWALDKLSTIDKIKKELVRRNSWQGKALSGKGAIS